EAVLLAQGDDAAQRQALDVLHDEEPAVALAVEVLDLDQVLVLHGGAEAGLVDEQLAEGLGALVLGEDQLDRHARRDAREALAARFVDQGHAPLRQGAHDPVAPQAFELAGAQGVGGGLHRLPRLRGIIAPAGGRAYIRSGAWTPSRCRPAARALAVASVSARREPLVRGSSGSSTRHWS